MKEGERKKEGPITEFKPPKKKKPREKGGQGNLSGEKRGQCLCEGHFALDKEKK